MAHNEIDVDAPPEAVFAVLADPRSFARWVVGSRAVRRADRHWPARGSAFDHRVGIGPLTLADHTEVLDVEPPRRLRLLVKARPLTRANVLLRIAPRGDAGSRVSMDEGPADLRTVLFMNPLSDPLLRLRNAESLKRLKALAEGRESIPDGELPPRESARDGAVEGSSRPAVT